MNFHVRRFIDIWYTVLVLSIAPLARSDYELNDDSAHGVRIASNDQLTIFARNVDGGYVVLYSMGGSLYNCTMPYPDPDHYVYSLDVMRNKNDTNASNTFKFVQVAENKTNNAGDRLSVVTVVAHYPKCNASFEHTPIWDGTHQEYMNVKVDPPGEYAYVFADSFVLSFDIAKNRIHEVNSSFPGLPHAFDLTDRWAIVTGLGHYYNYVYPIVYLVQLQPLSFITEINPPFEVMFDGIFTEVYARAYEMPVALNPRQDTALIGFPIYDTVWLVTVNATSLNSHDWNIALTNQTVWPTLGIGFGRSIAWIDNNTIVVTVLNVPNRSWSQSELWMFDVNKPLGNPLVVFPNSQQRLILTRPPLFLHTVFSPGYLFVLTDQRNMLLYPLAPAGYTSVWSSFSFYPTYLRLWLSPCVAGTYKSEPGFGPCIVCPPQTRNPADYGQPCTACTPCASNSFCPLGATDNVLLDALPSYTQSYAYPDMPDVSNYDDLLLQNMFVIPNSSSCIVLLPLFWALIVIGLCLFVWFIMALLKSRRFHSTRRYRNRAKRIFQGLDIINEGERWLGGLFSLAAVVLMGFSYWYAASYIELYPIETSGSMTAACDHTLRNAMFSNGLQLPLPIVDGGRWAIFALLEQQPFTMTVDLVNTRADCASITVQQDRPSVSYLLLKVQNCTLGYSNNGTRSVSFALPPDPTTVQLNITGTYFIGGIRLCLQGPGLTQGVNTLHPLDTCQFYFTANDTLGHSVTMPIALIRTINQTKPLQVGGEVLYDGRWTATWNTANGLSDQLIYEHNGEYLRYASYQTVITISLIEHPFYLLNTQQPIIRSAELAFHMLLFTSLIIELFGFVFLFVKLAILPIVVCILRHWRGRKRSMPKEAPSSSHQAAPSITGIFTLSSDEATPVETSKSRSSMWLSRSHKRRKQRYQQKDQQQHDNEVVDSKNIDISVKPSTDTDSALATADQVVSHL